MFEHCLFFQGRGRQCGVGVTGTRGDGGFGYILGGGTWGGAAPGATEGQESRLPHAGLSLFHLSSQR